MTASENGRSERLEYGTKAGSAAFDFANHTDCERFGMEHSGGAWARCWVAERLRFQDRVGVLAVDETSNTFNLFRRIPQPHPFHELITLAGGFCDWMLPEECRPLDKWNSECINKLDCVCSFRGLQNLSPQDLCHFMNIVDKGLHRGGRFVVAFTHYFLSTISADALEILQASPIKRKKNKLVPKPGAISVSHLISLAPSLVPEKCSNASFMPGGSNYNERSLLANSNLIHQKYKDIFIQNYNAVEREALKAAEDVRSVFVGYCFVKI